MTVEFTDIVRNFVRRNLEKPLIRNDLRGGIVEEIVAVALAADWQHCGSDWAGWDFQHCTSATRIQIKQSAARQTWQAPTRGYTQPRFQIPYKTGYYLDAKWIDGRSRNAEIFIFAWHSLLNELCDHRQPTQWIFFVVAEKLLPDASTISLRRLQSFVSPVAFDALAGEVNRLVISI